MTVKELREILDGCNDDAIVITHREHSERMLRDEQVYHEVDSTSNVVVFDIDDTYTPVSERTGE